MDSSSIIDEAKWSWSKAVSKGLIDEDDTSVLFQSWDRLKMYTEHLVDSFSHSNALHAVAIKTQPHPKVLERIVAGRLNKQIADDLNISIKTVEAHRANIMEKLNVNTVADLLRLALSDPQPN